MHFSSRNAVRPVCNPVQAESEIAYAKGRVKPLARLLRFATALRVTAPLGCGSRRLVCPKGSLSARPHGPNAPVWGVVQCYRTISNEIQNHWLISASPLFPHKQPSLRIGPEQSRARSGEANPVTKTIRPSVTRKTPGFLALSANLIRVRKPGGPPCRIVVNRASFCELRFGAVWFCGKVKPCSVNATA